MRGHMAEKSRGSSFNRSVFVKPGLGCRFLSKKKKKKGLHKLKVEQFMQRAHCLRVLSSLYKVSCSYNIQFISHIPSGVRETLSGAAHQ